MLFPQTKTINYFKIRKKEKKKKTWKKSQMKAIENRLDDVTIISQSTYDIKPVSVCFRPLDSMRYHLEKALKSGHQIVLGKRVFPAEFPCEGSCNTDVSKTVIN